MAPRDRLKTEPGIDGSDLQSFVMRQLLAGWFRTCKTFYEAGNVILWRELPSLIPLIQCMPSSLWKLDQDNLSFCRPIFPSDWPRFSHLASFVKVLNTSNVILDPTVFSNLGACRPALSLLPNLRTLRWYGQRETFHHAHWLLSPALTELQVSIRKAQVPAASAIIHAIGTRCPTLKSLRMDCQWLAYSEPDGHAIPADCSIECYHVVNWGDLVEISKLSHLETLHVELWSGLQDYSSTIPQSAFLALKRIRLAFYTFATCTRAVKLFRSSKLQSLHLIFVAPASYEGMLAFLQDIGHIDHDSLESFFVEWRGWEDDRDDGYFMLGPSALSPLFVFRHLRVFKMRFGYNFEQADAVLSDMGLAWPLLQELKFGCWILSLRKTLMKISSLRVVAERFHNLQRFCVPIDASDIPPTLEGRPGGRIFNGSITALGLTGLPVLNQMEVAIFLSDLLPNLSTIEGDPGWEETLRLMRGFAIV
ncbi:hypothetical protein JAAARDRAFT_199641 [Jaapia argillacea MUCL 33604]|uniref:F-box domain-containing protein n=1 Tax=Jaapia argillacea MUCL 33604 TaxID=933084 RepID=A0A067PAD3_9AGAM|nr:hypothetical protein JAAARDRAFT_199641 [Jaapia argillacea MUCL 33604]